MSLNRLALLLAGALLPTLSAADTAVQLQQSAAEWRSLAMRDLDFMAQQLREQHVGAALRHGNVLAPLERGVAAARSELEQVSDEGSYLRLLASLDAGFGDPHTAADLGLRTRAWTGLLVDHVQGRFRVSWSEPQWPTPLPPVGSELKACEDVWVGSFLAARVAPYSNVRAESAHALSAWARAMMQDRGLAQVPRQCDFRLADGSLRRYELPLQGVPVPVSVERLAQAIKHFGPETATVGTRRLSRSITVVSFPHFNPAGDAGRAAFDQVASELRSLRASHHAPKWLVFDLRGNGGGDSSLGANAITAYFGETVWTALEDQVGLRKQYLARPGVASYFGKLRDLPALAAHRDMLTRLAARLDEAVAAGQPVIDDPDQRTYDPVAAQRVLAKQSSPTRVAALIDRDCFSSCMNFVLHLKAMPGSLVLGEATQYGWSPYGEIQNMALPSGRGELYLPTAFYDGGQARREPFSPDLPFSGNLADSKAVWAWVTKALH